jgi:drug/metabolite transporter (DMT)-like permease
MAYLLENERVDRRAVAGALLSVAGVVLLALTTP